MERLQKLIASCGLCSRRTAEQWISEGRVTVNGVVASLGDSACETDVVLVDGNPLPRKERFVYLMLNKPRGYVTTMSDERGRPTVAELVDCGCRVYPIGRLDYDSEGLLLFTNDGGFANRLMHPTGDISKTYHVTVTGASKDAECLLRRPIILDGYRIKAPQVRLIRSSGQKTCFEITIYEGRNRQIRRMCEAAHLEVRRLCRVKEGPISLGDLAVGKWRYLNDDELRSLGRES